MEASLAASSLLAAAAAVVWLTADGTRTRVSGPVPARLRGDRLAWSVALYFAIQSMAFYIGLSWLPSILADDGGYSDQTAGLLQALSALAQLPTAYLVPELASRRRGQGAILAAIVAVSAIAVLGLIVAEAPRRCGWWCSARARAARSGWR